MIPGLILKPLNQFNYKTLYQHDKHEINAVHNVELYMQCKFILDYYISWTYMYLSFLCTNIKYNYGMVYLAMYTLCMPGTCMSVYAL